MNYLGLRTVELIVPGIPQPKGSGSKTKAGNYIEAGTKDRTLEDGTKVVGTRTLKRLWGQQVQRTAEGLVSEPLDGPLFFGAWFFFDAPKSGKASRRVYHDVKPDLDKLIRAIWDPLTKAKLIRDDSRIVRITGVGKYTIQNGGQPRIELVIGELDA